MGLTYTILLIGGEIANFVLLYGEQGSRRRENVALFWDSNLPCFRKLKAVLLHATTLAAACGSDI